MNTAQNLATTSPIPSAALAQTGPAAECAYRGLTIAAMVLILASILLV